MIYILIQEKLICPDTADDLYKEKLHLVAPQDKRTKEMARSISLLTEFMKSNPAKLIPAMKEKSIDWTCVDINGKVEKFIVKTHNDGD